MKRTSQLKRYAIIIRSRYVQFFIRPPLRGNVKYRHPILDHEKWFRTKKDALRAVRQWELV